MSCAKSLTARAISYAELARRIGQPGASRAVGSANGQNPIAIIVPCHRVIASGGGLGGYGGGLDRKRWLLEHEAYGPGTAPERGDEPPPKCPRSRSQARLNITMLAPVPVAKGSLIRTGYLIRLNGSR